MATRARPATPQAPSSGFRKCLAAASVLALVIAVQSCRDDDQLFNPELMRPMAAEQGETGPFPKSGLFSVYASGQTGRSGKADDPAIWVHPTDPSLSLVIGTDKESSGGLHVFDLAGNELQFMRGGKHNNADVRYGFMLGGESVDLVSVCDRNNDQIDIYKIDPTTRQLTQVGTIQARTEVYGYAMYHSRATGKIYGITASGDGVEQWEFVDQGGSVGGVLVRAWEPGPLIEGVVADDELGYLYLAEESNGIYKYGAEPEDDPGFRETVDVTGSGTGLVEDVEGLTIYYRENGLGYLIASSQGNDRFIVYRREGGNDYLGQFEVARGAIRGTDATDGIDVTNTALGSLYPLGMFVAHDDDDNNFKLVRWEDIAGALGLAIDTEGYDERGDGGEPPVPVESVVVSPATHTMAIGESVTLTAIPKDADGNPLDRPVTWSSNDEGVATVDEGEVTGVGVGTATIQATSGGVTGTAEITVTVADPDNLVPVVEAGADATIAEGSSFDLTASFTDGNPEDAHTASIDWGDGSPAEPGNLTEGGGSGTVQGSHTYADDGAYTVTVTVNDGRGGTGEGSLTVTVDNVAPTAAAGGPFAGDEGSTISLGGGATDPGADELTFEWDFDYDGVTFQIDVTGETVEKIYSQDGGYTAGLRVTDDDGGVSTVAIATVTVSDLDPVADFDFAPSSPTVGATVSFTDASTSYDGIAGWEWDFDVASGPAVNSTDRNPTHSYDAAGTYTVRLTVRESDGDESVAERQVVVSEQQAVALYFSLNNDVNLDGLQVEDEDIVAFDGAGFSLYFDGSDVGLAGARIDGFAVVGGSQILLSFTSGESVPGISGTVDDSDIVRFTATSLGASTVGSFELYFDGSDVGLTRSGEDVDAIELLPDGTLLISTTSSFSVSGLSGRDEDIIAFSPTSLGPSTSGTFGLYFDGGDVGLGSSDEDVRGLAIDSSGKMYFSTSGNFSVSGLSGADEDVFGFSPTSLGSTTRGTFDSFLFFDGSQFGLAGDDIYGIDLP